MTPPRDPADNAGGRPEQSPDASPPIDDRDEARVGLDLEQTDDLGVIGVDDAEQDEIDAGGEAEGIADPIAQQRKMESRSDEGTDVMVDRDEDALVVLDVDPDLEASDDDDAQDPLSGSLPRI